MKSLIWVKVLLSLILIIVFSVCLINYIVDPYNLYKTNLFKNKPKEFEYMRLIKAINIEKIKPSSIVLGTSRAEMAIDPDHEYFYLMIHPDYQHYGIGSAIIEDLIEYVENLCEEGTEIMLDLMCAIGREPFYHKHEFISRPTDKLGPGMIRYIRR